MSAISENVLPAWQDPLSFVPQTQEPDFLKTIRKEAAASFVEYGIPTTRHEEWKYFNLSHLKHQAYQLVSAVERPVRSEDKATLRLSEGKSLCLITENGILNDAASQLKELPVGLRIGSLQDFLHDPLVEQHLAKHAALKNEPFVSLNTASMQDVLVILVDAKADIEPVIEVLHFSGSDQHEALTPQRVLIVLGAHARLKVTERYLSNGNALPYLATSVVESILGENASLHQILVQEESEEATRIHFQDVTQEKNSQYTICTLGFGAAMLRNNLHIELAGENCAAHLNGLMLAGNNQVMDNHTLVDHAMPNCFSNELYKNILGGQSQGVFNGKIFVRQDAQKTNAFQSNKNLLLTNTASMNTKPQLEIYADDVKCSHGTTTGQIDEEALFYLRARGIGEARARVLLNHAFAADVVDTVAVDEVKAALSALVDQRLSELEA